MTRVAEEPPPLPDACHCLLHQLPCPSTINFDVEPNEIRPNVEAEADSCLVCASARRRLAAAANESGGGVFLTSSAVLR